MSSRLADLRPVERIAEADQLAGAARFFRHHARDFVRRIAHNQCQRLSNMRNLVAHNLARACCFRAMRAGSSSHGESSMRAHLDAAARRLCGHGRSDLPCWPSVLGGWAQDRSEGLAQCALMTAPTPRSSSPRTRATTRPKASRSRSTRPGGSGEAVTRIGSGTYDFGFGDINVLMEFNAKNPANAGKAVYMLYYRSPLSVGSFAKTGISKPADLNGKKIGGALTDGAYKLFPGLRQARLDQGRLDQVAVSAICGCARRCCSRATSTRSSASTRRCTSISCGRASRQPTSSFSTTRTPG